MSAARWGARFRSARKRAAEGRLNRSGSAGRDGVIRGGAERRRHQGVKATRVPSNRGEGTRDPWGGASGGDRLQGEAQSLFSGLPRLAEARGTRVPIGKGGGIDAGPRNHRVKASSEGCSAIAARAAGRVAGSARETPRPSPVRGRRRGGHRPAMDRQGAGGPCGRSEATKRNRRADRGDGEASWSEGRSGTWARTPVGRARQIPRPRRPRQGGARESGGASDREGSGRVRCEGDGRAQGVQIFRGRARGNFTAGIDHEAGPGGGMAEGDGPPDAVR